MSVRILIGDCVERMRELPDNSVDSVVCDPPYHLTSIVKRFGSKSAAPAKAGKTGAYARASKGFMGQTWDGGDVAFQPETWAEVLRVLKPGGHLIAFSGTRTYHRMAVAIEDAGFEVRDMIAWHYASGFPKSHDISKAIDKAAGAEREVVGQAKGTGKQNPRWNGTEAGRAKNHLAPVYDATIPATDAAREWEGWGTALKPSLEPVCLAQKPYTNQQEWVTIRSLIEGLWSALWWTLPASDAARSSTLNPSVCGVDLSASAQWPAERLSNTRDALSAQMDMSQFELALTSSLNTASSWHATLADLCRAESTSTIGTASSTTIDLRTLRFCLSRITPESIILAHRSGAWSSADACNAARYLNATLATLDATLELSALAPAIASEVQASPAEGATSTEQICLARKPLSEKSIAANVLKWGTGALNIDACRIEGEFNDSEPYAYKGDNGVAMGAASERLRKSGGGATSPQGRWPANLCHDGSDEVVAGFPETTSGILKAGTQRNVENRVYGKGMAAAGKAATEYDTGGDSGSAARFFYCAKATTEERGEGNVHPTVKPVALMRWLVRLVTPKGGTVLDPFMGSGSTGLACDAEQFDFIGCEMSPEYAAIAERRIRDAAGMFADVKVAA